jgi:hypothetical protein
MLVVAASALVFSAPRAGAQIAYTRFDITSVDDTTFTFAAAGVEWLKRSQEGLVVDPTHGDELIAKFRVLRVHNGTATAVVTGQTARLAGSYVALLSEPHHPFYTRPWFWIAVAVGGAIGYVVHR